MLLNMSTVSRIPSVSLFDAQSVPHFTVVETDRYKIVEKKCKKGKNGKNCSHIIVKLFGKYVHYDRNEYETYKKNIDMRGNEEIE